MLKKSLFFFEEFPYITSFTTDRYSRTTHFDYLTFLPEVKFPTWQVED